LSSFLQSMASCIFVNPGWNSVSYLSGDSKVAYFSL